MKFSLHVICIYFYLAVLILNSLEIASIMASAPGKFLCKNQCLCCYDFITTGVHRYIRPRIVRGKFRNYCTLQTPEKSGKEIMFPRTSDHRLELPPLQSVKRAMNHHVQTQEQCQKDLFKANKLDDNYSAINTE